MGIVSHPCMSHIFAEVCGPSIYKFAFPPNPAISEYPPLLRSRSLTNVNYLNLGSIDPRQNDQIHDDGEGAVHAPN